MKYYSIFLCNITVPSRFYKIRNYAEIRHLFKVPLDASLAITHDFLSLKKFNSLLLTVLKKMDTKFSP